MKTFLIILAVVAGLTIVAILFKGIAESIDEIEEEYGECVGCKYKDECDEDCDNCPCANCPVGCSSFGNPDADIDDDEYDDEYDCDLDDDFI